MTMYRRMIAVLGAVLVVIGVGGFFMLKESAVGPSPALDRALVTGYATSSISGRTSGAVSVELNGASAARIDQIVEGLPPANLKYICAENAQEYHISFTTDAGAGAGVRQGFGLTGYRCNNLVVEVPWHGSTQDRIDRNCALLAAVRRLLPARATATRAAICAHANRRLFVAVSRHATATHKTATHKTATHKTATHKTPAYKTATHATATHKSARREAPKRGRVKRGTLKRGTPKRETLKRETPVRVMSGRGTPRSETRDVKKVVTAPTLG
jgi:hypothetical protein